MISTEMKEECDRRRDEIEHDAKFQEWISDIKCCVNMYKNVQDDRIRISNQSKKKKGGGKQKIPANQKNWKISPEQTKFNETAIEDRWVNEKKIEARLKELVSNKDYPIYNDFLRYITGFGAVSAAYLLATFRPERIYYVTNLWAFAGIVTGKDKLIKGTKASFNTFLKSKLLGVIGGNFMQNKSEYALYYYQKRIHLINRDVQLIKAGKMCEKFGEHEDGKLDRLTAAHHTRMATRDMMQMFVRDYYVGYRTIMNIPVIPGYAEAVLNLSHVGESFVSYDLIREWSKETPEQHKARRQEVLRRLSEMKKTLNSLCIRYGYREDDDDTEE